MRPSYTPPPSPFLSTLPRFLYRGSLGRELKELRRHVIPRDLSRSLRAAVSEVVNAIIALDLREGKESRPNNLYARSKRPLFHRE